MSHAAGKIMKKDSCNRSKGILKRDVKQNNRSKFHYAGMQLIFFEQV